MVKIPKIDGNRDPVDIGSKLYTDGGVLSKNLYSQSETVEGGLASKPTLTEIIGQCRVITFGGNFEAENPIHPVVVGY